MMTADKANKLYNDARIESCIKEQYREAGQSKSKNKKSLWE